MAQDSELHKIYRRHTVIARPVGVDGIRGPIPLDTPRRRAEYVRVEGGGIDCRTVDARWLCGVHDKKIQASSYGGGGSSDGGDVS